MKKSDILYKNINIAKTSFSFPQYPLYAYLIINNRCNLRCCFCSRENIAKDIMSFDDFCQTITILKTLGIIDVYITGGEPLLHPDFEKMVRYAKMNDVQISVLTNGVLIKEHIDILKDVKCVSVSLHGTKQTHDQVVGMECYDLIKKNICSISKYTNIAVNYTVFSQNLNLRDILSVYEFCREHGFRMNIARYNDSGCGKINHCNIDLNQFAKIMDELYARGMKIEINNCIPPCTVEKRFSYLTHGCGAGYLFCCIDTELNVKICPSSNILLGNLKTQSFKKIWKQKLMKDYRSFQWAPIQCKNCIYLSQCKCGCKIELNNTFPAMNDKHVYEQNEKIWNSIVDSTFYVNVNKIRREGKNFINLSKPVRLFNKKVRDILEQVQSCGKISKFVKYKDLIITLYRDKIIKVKENYVKQKNIE